MTGFRRGLIVLGFVSALGATGALTAQAKLLRTIDIAQEDVPTDAPTDAPVDTPGDAPTDMPADVSMDVATATPTPSPTATVTPTPSPTATPTATPVPVPILVQQVIQRSNDEQVQAISTRNLSLITDTLTADHVPELTAILQDMIDHKVNSIELLKLDWGPVVVAPDGSHAVATTTETWRITSAAGTVEDAPVRNDYTMVLDGGTWKIKSDVQVGPSSQP
jgi:hypothetical protein